MFKTKHKPDSHKTSLPVGLILSVPLAVLARQLHKLEAVANVNDNTTGGRVLHVYCYPVAMAVVLRRRLPFKGGLSANSVVKPSPIVRFVSKQLLGLAEIPHGNWDNATRKSSVILKILEMYNVLHRFLNF